MNNIVIEPTIEQRKLLDLHLKLVIEENKKINLTRITNWESAQILHIEDSLVGLPEVAQAPSGRYLDMGTGGGFPGIPLAIMTKRETVLADSVGKKIAALDRIIAELDLGKFVSTYKGRLEELSLERPRSFSLVTARALSTLSSLMELASPLLETNGYLICYKSQEVEAELCHAKEISDKFGLSFISKRDVLLSDEKTHRSIITFKKIGEPIIDLPRRNGMAQKKPY